MACCDHFLSLSRFCLPPPQPSPSPLGTMRQTWMIQGSEVAGSWWLLLTSVQVYVWGRVFTLNFSWRSEGPLYTTINYSIKCFSCSVKFWCVFHFDIWLHCQCISIISYIGKDMWCKLIFETRYCYFLAVKCLWKMKHETAHLQLHRGNRCCFVTLQETRVILKHHRAK